jgi:hypothetical protein
MALRVLAEEELAGHGMIAEFENGFVGKLVRAIEDVLIIN